MRSSRKFLIPPGFTRLLCIWLEKREAGMCFQGGGWNHGLDALAAFDFYLEYRGDVNSAVSFCQSANDWVFCHLNYDVKNELEELTSNNVDVVNFPLYSFFMPQVVVKVRGGEAEFLFRDEIVSDTIIDEYFHAICAAEEMQQVAHAGPPTAQISEDQYLSDLNALGKHLQRGDIYQANYCHAFYWNALDLSPAALFNEGYAQMPNPFSVFYNVGDHALMCFSPERFVQVLNGRISSQPMKGTAPRGTNAKADREYKEELEKSEKDRRENVMIVDLVRNDLSHFARQGSVKVPELYVVKAYPKVHQMHSTVEAELQDGVHPLSAVLKAFPMGSMTGAPKISAMRILEALEHTKRGIYSGTVGYFDPSGNADFNVVIRSLVYRKSTGYLSCNAGGGITILSDYKKEYQESLLKLKPLMELVSHYQST